MKLKKKKKYKIIYGIIGDVYRLRFVYENVLFMNLT